MIVLPSGVVSVSVLLTSAQLPPEPSGPSPVPNAKATSASSAVQIGVPSHAATVEPMNGNLQFTSSRFRLLKPLSAASAGATDMTTAPMIPSASANVISLRDVIDVSSSRVHCA